MADVRMLLAWSPFIEIMVVQIENYFEMSEKQPKAYAKDMRV